MVVVKGGVVKGFKHNQAYGFSEKIISEQSSSDGIEKGTQVDT